ncbi:solute carrier family 22 member 15-like [Haliotis cracherodii]|uniref:solute carrier family 22 member 15-like n=1 Tax=Haliotis cracherodii TaxID=6455 RepID=UPI0039E9FDB8
MCRYNKREKPSNTAQLLKEVAEEEERLRASGKKYTYLDIYRRWSICWKSLIIQFLWMCLSMVYYGISFGVGRLAGNLYLNIFLLAVVEVPATVKTFFMNNKFGRRWTSFMFFVIAVSGAFGVAITTRTVSGEKQGIIINVLAMGTKIGVGAAWCAVQLWSSETYPTVTRNLGYGAANTTARIGGMVAPFIFAMAGDDVLVPFVIVGSTMAVCGVLCLILKETKGQPLADSISKVNSAGQVEMVATSSDMEKAKI